MNSETKNKLDILGMEDVFDEGARHLGSGFQKNVKFISFAIFFNNSESFLDSSNMFCFWFRLSLVHLRHF